MLEAVLARGDRRLADVIEAAWRGGSRLDGWEEHLRVPAWRRAFEECGIDPAFYACRRRSEDEIFPWDHLDYGITKDFLRREHRLAIAGTTTPSCFVHCNGCGADRLTKGECRCK